MSYFVYIHECPNGKKYVGVTTQRLNKRWGLNGEGYCHNKHFYAAISKYGWDNIKHTVFEVDTKQEMFYLERYLIIYYQSNNRKYGYNKSLGGEIGPIGCKHSLESRQKMSKSCLGHIVTDETRAKIGMANKGHIVTDETRAKIRSKNKNYMPTNAIKIAINDIVFPSISRAAKYIGTSYANLHRILSCGHQTYKNFEIKKLI